MNYSACQLRSISCVQCFIFIICFVPWLSCCVMEVFVRVSKPWKHPVFLVSLLQLKFKPVYHTVLSQDRLNQSPGSFPSYQLNQPIALWSCDQDHVSVTTACSGVTTGGATVFLL